MGTRNQSVLFQRDFKEVLICIYGCSVCFHIYAPFACLGGQKKMLVPVELELCQL